MTPSAWRAVLVAMQVAALVAALLAATACGSAPSGTPGRAPTPRATPRPTPRRPAPGVAIARPDEAATAVDARRRALSTAGRGIPADEVGYYVDVLEARLRQTRTIGLIVTRSEQRLSVELTDRTFFDVGSAVLTADARRSLANLTAVLTQYDRTIVAVHAHQPASGTPVTDQQLAERRAFAVALQFVVGGVAAARLIAVGHSGGASTAPRAGGEEQVSTGRIVLWLDAVRR